MYLHLHLVKHWTCFEIQSVGCMFGSIIGPLWADGRILVNGRQMRMAFSSLPTDEWGHVHLEASHQFTVDLLMMARSSAGSGGDTVFGCMKGRVAEVYFWDWLLPEYTIATLQTGFNQLPVRSLFRYKCMFCPYSCTIT